MSKILIMFTMTYPFGKGEVFLANEYDAINKIYDKIYVFSLAVPNKYKLTYKLGEKWQVFRRNEMENKRKKRLDYFIDGLKFINDPDLIDEVRQNNKILAKMMAIYYYGRLQSYKQFIEKHLGNLSFDSNDLVVIYSVWFLQFAQCSILLKRYLKKKYHCKVLSMSRAHRYDLYEYIYKANYLPFRRYMLKNIDAVYPCSTNGVEYLSNKYNEYKNKIKCSYLGSMDHGINHIAPNVLFTIITCSNIIPVKRVKLVAEALKLIEEHGIIDIQWLCVGDGMSKKEVVDFCKKNIKKIKVQFYGYLENEKLFDLYKTNRVDVFINVSSNEGLPMTIMEAQSEGIPVIATDVGGTNEIVKSDNGILLPSNPTPDELAKAILIFKNMSYEEHSKIRDSSRNNWAMYFDAKKNNVKFHKELIERLQYDDLKGNI